MKKSEETGKVKIYQETDYENENIMVYDSGNVYQSATYLDKDKRYELVFEYMRQFNRAFDLFPGAKDILMLGGGRYAYPKYVISHYPETAMDVVEIDSEAWDIACKSFYLNDLITEYDLENNDRLNNIVMDAEDYIYQCDKTYDIIVDDIYLDIEPLFSLLTLEAFSQFKTLLNKNGILVLNLPGYRKHQNTEYLLNVLRTLQEVFDNVQLVKAFNYRYTKTGNYVILASDNPLKLKESLEYDTSESVLITLRDCEKLRDQFYEFVEK